MGNLAYNPALDGIRAIAVLAAITYHTRVPGMEWGYLGVDAFFVLSGFLITSILARQHEAGGIQLVPFYLKRARRLYPALLLMLALYLAVAPWIWPGAPNVQDALISALYLSDYGVAFWDRPVVLGHTWSLAVEEHFYLIWPLILPALLNMDRKGLVRLLTIAFLAATAWRLNSLGLFGVRETMSRFDTKLSGLILGALLALAPAIAWDRRWLWAGLVVAVAVGAAAFHPHSVGLSMFAAEMATAAIILLCVTGDIPALSHPAVAYIGRISYGLYLFHYPITRWARPQFDWLTSTSIVLVATFALAVLSYHLWESRFRHGGALAYGWPGSRLPSKP